MPISSAEIMQLNSSFMQMHASQLQYSQQIGQGQVYGMNPYAQAEGMAGGAINRASAVAAPLATAGLAIAGLDPISLGVRSGIGAYGAGMGVGGAAMVGAGVALPAMAAFGAASYAGNQMMTGAQQVQAFNSNMRGSYNFFNPSNISGGGRGFGQGDIRQIGELVRTMTGSIEGAGFDELGRLATNMGRMGLADGVRNAKEFSERFRQMVKTVKAIADDLGTSLEEAQTMMAAMKGSGIFRNQQQVVSQIRASSVAGGLATSEVTGMMSVGSQISRMFGGTGRAGAMGGMEAITQVGVAQQIGALSEEDIYNATGMTGAEGRRAMAQQQLMQTGRFLRSGKGRYFLASVAGKDGQLDPESVLDWMSGGMTVGATQQQAHRNLGRIGRANFIRNEGRLRGAVMEEFGGLAPAMALSQWAQGRGIDINDMDDRSMLFAQRQLGMGRDEIDSAIKMARSMPDILRRRRESREDDSLLRDTVERRKYVGVEGLKRRFDQSRDKINNELQRAGQDVMNFASEQVASFANRLAGEYEEAVVEGLRESYRAASMGGAGGKASLGRLFGGKLGPSDPGLQGLVRSGTTGGSVMTDPAALQQQQRQLDLQQAARLGELGRGVGGFDPSTQAAISRNRSAIRDWYARSGAATGGFNRTKNLEGFLQSADPELARRMASMTDRERMQFVAGIEREVGITSDARIGESFKEMKPPRQIGVGRLFTASQFHETRGKALMGMSDSGLEATAKGIVGDLVEGAGIGAKIGMTIGQMLMGRSFSDSLSEADKEISALRSGATGIVDAISGKSSQAKAASEFMSSRAGRESIFGILTGDKAGIEAAQDDMTGLRGKIARGEELSPAERARLSVLDQTFAASDLNKLVAKRGGLDKLTDSDWDSMVRRLNEIKTSRGEPANATREDVKRSYGTIMGEAAAEQKRIIRQVAEQVGKSSSQRRREYEAGGLAEMTKEGKLVLSETARGRLGKEASQVAEMALAATQTGEAAMAAATPEEQRALLEKQATQQGDIYEKLGGMSVTGLRQLARGAAGTALGGQASEQIMLTRRMESRLRKARRRGGGGAAGAIAGELGLDLSRDELSGLEGLSAQEAAARLASRLGVSGDEQFTKSLQESISAAGSKGGAGLSAALVRRAVAQAGESTREKIQEATGRGPDPMEKLISKIGEGNKYLQALVKSNDKAAAELSRISGEEKADGEKGG